MPNLVGCLCRCATIDGDCDRLMYFTPTGDGPATLFDGDRVAVLAAAFVHSLIQQLPASVGDTSVSVSACMSVNNRFCSALSQPAASRQHRGHVGGWPMRRAPMKLGNIHSAGGAF